MIFHPSHGFLTLSRDAYPEVFELTCGGFGLTGFIVSCVLKASPIPSSYVAKKVLKFDNWKEGMKLFEIESQNSDFINSWHDYSSNSSLEKSGLLFSSRFVPLDEIELRNEKNLRQIPKQKIGLVNHPFNLYNKFGLKLLNKAYRIQSANTYIPSHYSLENALFPIHKTKIYFAGYGQSGFHEYQVILPKQAVEGFMHDIVSEAKKLDMQLPLISGKLFGGDQKLLRFMGEGYAIAINFPRNNRSEKFAELIDEKTLRYEGRPNLIKDSRLPREILEATYTETDEFRKKLRDFDPKRLVVSEFSQRLGI
jgi:decaprenylphospho-beta-D-ribofuranose 2-oxidase